MVKGRKPRLPDPRWVFTYPEIPDDLHVSRVMAWRDLLLTHDETGMLVLAVDARDGTLAWTYDRRETPQRGGYPHAQITPSDSQFLLSLAGARSYLIAFDSKGSSRTLYEKEERGMGLLQGDLAYFLGESTFAALDARDGSLRLERRDEYHVDNEEEILAWPGRLIGGNKGKAQFVIVDTTTGEILRRLDSDIALRVTSGVTTEDRLIAMRGDGTIALFAANSYRTTHVIGQPRALGQIRVSEGRVYWITMPKSLQTDAIRGLASLNLRSMAIENTVEIPLPWADCYLPLKEHILVGGDGMACMRRSDLKPLWCCKDRRVRTVPVAVTGTLVVCFACSRREPNRLYAYDQEDLLRLEG